MTYQSNIKKLLIYTLFSLVVAFILTLAINSKLKTRYMSEINISTIYNNNSITLETIRMYLGYDPTTDFVNDYINKLNLRINNSKNSCLEIEKNNRIIPFMITKRSHGFKIEISSIDKKKIVDCQNFISKDIERENLRIADYLTSLMQIKKRQRQINNKEARSIDVEKIIYYLNFAKEKFEANTNMDENVISLILSDIILNIIPINEFRNDNDLITDNTVPLDSLKKINYFQIISDKINTDEKTPQTFLFLGLFLITLFILIITNKAIISKKIIINKLSKLLE